MSKTPSDKLPTLLLCTDAEDIVFFFKTLLDEEYPILHVTNDKDCLETLSTTKIAVIIIDDKIKGALPILLQTIKKLPDAKSLPILVISAHLQKSYMKTILTAGATEILREPLEKEAVLASITRAMHTQTVQQKLLPLSQSLSHRESSPEKKLSGTRITVHEQGLGEIHKALKLKQSISLLMLDIEYLETVKKRWGDVALQELLHLIDAHLKTLLRPQDLVIHTLQHRYVIILPKTSDTAAKILGETVEESFKNTPFTLSHGKVQLPISIAIVTLLDKDMHIIDAYQHLEKMLSTGEARLEKAKTIGKRIVSN
jgi:diguanylate cyclase (GGDEF)-like protein